MCIRDRYRYDPDREAAVLRYVKDLGLNMLRWESKISSEHIIELADEQGIPLMFGWMCCNQWEMWDQWDEEDHRVAEASLQSQILMLRHHPLRNDLGQRKRRLTSRPRPEHVSQNSHQPALAKRYGRHRLFFRQRRTRRT